MKISEYIKKLEDLKNLVGDVNVVTNCGSSNFYTVENPQIVHLDYSMRKTNGQKAGFFHIYVG